MLFSCSKTSDVDILKQRVVELITHIEQHNEQGIKDYLSNDFSASQRFNKVQFFIFVRHHFKRNKSISVSILDKKITHYKDYTDVTANALLLGSNEWLPERGQIYIVSSRWKKESGDWVMSRLRWEKEMK